MSIFRITAYDKRTVVQIIALVDIIQSLLYIAIKSFAIVFSSVPESEQKVYPFITLFFAFIMCFYLVHLTLALKLLTALDLDKQDFLTAAQNAKVWQNWSIVYLIFLVGNCFSNILSAQSWVVVLFVALGIVEILWRLVGIYNVGIYIDDLLEKISFDSPTIKFFSVRFPIPAEYQDDLNPISESPALALITIIFDLRQLVTVAIEGVPEDKENVQRTDSDDDESFYIRLILAAVASVGLTLTQLLLACLMMVTLSYGEEERSIQRNTYIVSAIWAIWSTVLLIVLIVYASNISQFEDFGDKFYLFMLVSEIVLRVCIILYTSLFFGCQCFKI